MRKMRRAMPSVEGRTLGDLPDVNVWIALLNPQHTHHERAKQYWERSAAQSIGLCRTTMLGLLRLCTNKAVMGGTPYTSEQAWTAYQSLIDLPEVVFFAEPLGIDAAMRRHCAHPLFRTADWTDAYLATFAQQARLRMVSFDKGFARYADLALLSL